jgi:iron(III) transport system substrate-binding protein
MLHTQSTAPLPATASIGGRRLAVAAVLLAAVLAPACRTVSEEAAPRPQVVVYSGRGESLAGPLFEGLEEALGMEIKVRYGGTAELAATLMEEGEATPADLFLSQDAAALGALADADLLVGLPPATLALVAPEFRSPEGEWIGLSGRVRCVVYNTERVRPEDLPSSLEQVIEPRFRGRFGIAPTNGSFQAHLAVYRTVAGRAALEELLAGLQANEPGRYPKNSAIVEAVIAGEIDFGLVNHYYLLRALAENPSAPAANYFMPSGGVSSFVNLSGVAALRSTPETLALVDALLAESAQRYFAEETFEYPLSAAVAPAAGLPPLGDLRARQLPFDRVAAKLEETLELIAASGLLG